MLKKMFVAVLATTLAACGGSSSTFSNSGSPTTSPTPDPVATASTTVASQLGLTAVPGNTSIAQAYDLTADIGDTWRLVLNQDGSYTITVLQTQYGLTNASGTYTQSTNGNFVTLTGANGSFTLVLDTRTKTIAGTVTLGSKTSGVSGSGYASPSDLTKLAGDYFYIGTTRNAADGSSPGFVGGTFRVAANGTDITLCDGGLINASGTCDAVAGGGTPTQVALTMVKNSTDGLTHVQMSGSDFGILSVQAGDRGAVLVIDRFGLNQSGVMRTGVMYATKQQVLAGTELNDTWSCVDRGTAVGTVTINGTTLTTTLADGATDTETLYYNQVNGTSLSPANGIVTSVVNGEAVSDGVLILPLSSSLFVVERDSTQSVAVCSVKH
jgi:hypothetical protein